jgi:hypothetical protein
MTCIGCNDIIQEIILHEILDSTASSGSKYTSTFTISTIAIHLILLYIQQK